MPVPKRKVSRSRRDKRSANKGIKPKQITGCQTCQAPIAPHQACQECGYYKGAKVLRTKLERMETRGKLRQEREDKRQARMGGESPAPSALELSSEGSEGKE